jgi:hypothetical protein
MTPSARWRRSGDTSTATSSSIGTPATVLPLPLSLSHAHAPPHTHTHTHRLYLVRELSEYAKEVGYEDTVSQLLPYLKEIQRVRTPSLTHSPTIWPSSLRLSLSLFRFRSSPERLLAA